VEGPLRDGGDLVPADVQQQEVGQVKGGHGPELVVLQLQLQQVLQRVESGSVDMLDPVPLQVEPLQQPQPVEGLIGDLLQLVGGQVQVDELRQGLEDVFLNAGDLVLGKVQELEGGQACKAVLAEHRDAVLKDVEGEGVGGQPLGHGVAPSGRTQDGLGVLALAA